MNIKRDRNDIALCIYHFQGTDAYKHWEVEENAKAVVDTVYDYILGVVCEELDSLKNTVTHMQNSKVTVYDPAHGEIQMDTYLPIDVTTLRELPRVNDTFDMTYLNKLRSYFPSRSTGTFQQPTRSTGTVQQPLQITVMQ